MQNIDRQLPLPSRSFFLFGPRGVGKSTWLKQNLPDAHFFNLLDEKLFLELSRYPENLEARIDADKKNTKWVCIDEIQRLPQLLNEVHKIIENKHFNFALTGSSARKLRKGGVNLLGGRAVQRELSPFTSVELKKLFDLEKTLEWGSLPLVVFSENKQDAADILSAYVNTYLKEEVRAEGLVRNIEPFTRFLEVAGLLNGQQVNLNNISRECAVPRNTVQSYFEILKDTLLGSYLLPYRPGLKVREQSHPKFYWFDSGVARAAADLLYSELDSSWKGFALETYLLHEIKTYNQVQQKNKSISYYRTASNNEIDFIIELKKRTSQSKAEVVAIEVKLSKKWKKEWEKTLRDLMKDSGIKVRRSIGVYLGATAYSFDGIDILPVHQFLEQLQKGEVF